MKKIYKDKCFTFYKMRTTKKNWEDTECDKCRNLLWSPGKIEYAWVHSGEPYIQLCEKCFDL